LHTHHEQTTSITCQVAETRTPPPQPITTLHRLLPATQTQGVVAHTPAPPNPPPPILPPSTGCSLPSKTCAWCPLRWPPQWPTTWWPQAWAPCQPTSPPPTAAAAAAPRGGHKQGPWRSGCSMWAATCGTRRQGRCAQELPAPLACSGQGPSALSCEGGDNQVGWSPGGSPLCRQPCWGLCRAGKSRQGGQGCSAPGCEGLSTTWLETPIGPAARLLAVQDRKAGGCAHLCGQPPA
jgi:hypothetical protein